MILIFGFWGGLRKKEILSCEFDGLEEKDDSFSIAFQPCKTGEANPKKRKFLIPVEDDPSCCPARIFSMYLALVKERKGFLFLILFYYILGN